MTPGPNSQCKKSYPRQDIIPTCMADRTDGRNHHRSVEYTSRSMKNYIFLGCILERMGENFLSHAVIVALIGNCLSTSLGDRKIILTSLPHSNTSSCLSCVGERSYCGNFIGEDFLSNPGPKEEKNCASEVPLQKTLVIML